MIVRKRVALIVAVTGLLGSFGAPQTPALAYSCYTDAVRRCAAHWPDRFRQYATIEDCIASEYATWCPPGTGGGGGGDPPYNDDPCIPGDWERICGGPGNPTTN